MGPSSLTPRYGFLGLAYIFLRVVLDFFSSPAKLNVFNAGLWLSGSTEGKFDSCIIFLECFCLLAIESPLSEVINCNRVEEPDKGRRWRAVSGRYCTCCLL